MSRSPFVLGDVRAWVTIEIAYPRSSFGAGLVLVDRATLERALDAVGLASAPDELEATTGCTAGALPRDDGGWRFRTRFASQFTGGPLGPSFAGACALASMHDDAGDPGARS